MIALREWIGRVPRAAVAVWVVLAAAVALRVVFASPNSGTVVPIYLKAGERWRAGENIYAPCWPLDIYRNPPGVAAFFAPWSLLPPKTAGILWRFLGLGLYLAGLAALARHRPEPLGRFALVAALLVIPSFNNGQVNVLLVGCLLLALANVGRDRFARAAAWVAFASFFKVYPLAVGLLFCVVKPRFALSLLPAFALAALLPFACQHPGYVADMHRAFVDFLELEGKYRLALDRPPWDWTILFRTWFDVRVPGDATKLGSALAGIAFAAMVWRKRRRPEEALPFAFGLGCVWMTLFGPATENATYTLIAPTVAALFLGPFRWGSLLALTLFLLPILRGLFPSGEVLPLRTAQPLGALVMLAVLLRDRSPAPSATCLGPFREVPPTVPPLLETVPPRRNDSELEQNTIRAQRPVAGD
jgi:Glycosyltransferase family 87